MAKIGAQIKARRQQLGLTLDQLAQKMGYKDKSSISKIENGKADIPQEKVERFARALDTSVSYLMGEETDTSQPQDRLIAFYGEVKDRLDESDKDDLIAFMRLKAQLKQKEP